MIENKHTIKLIKKTTKLVIMCANLILNLICKNTDITKASTAMPIAKTNPQKIKKLAEVGFSSPSLFLRVFKSFLVAKQITPKFNIKQMATIAKVFKIDNCFANIIIKPVRTIATNDVIEQNKILLNTTCFGVTGYVFIKL